MSKNILKIVSDAMAELGIAYDFGEYSGKVRYPYFTGEYTESEPMYEDGMQNSTFILTGFSRGKWLTLENAKDQIKNYFDKVSGKVVMAENGSAVAIFYANTLVIPTGDSELKKIQINLSCKEWSVN